MTHRRYVYRLYPTSRQTAALNRMLADHCELYNAALEERRTAWRTHRADVTIKQQQPQLTEMRAARPDQAVWSFTSQQMTLRRLEEAYRRFYKRLRLGQPPGYPRYRSVRRFDSVDFRHGDGLKWIDRGRRGHAALYVKGVGHVDVRMHRRLPDGVKLGHVTVHREGYGTRARWHLQLVVDRAVQPLPASGRQIGVDLGLTHAATLTEPVSGLTDGEGHVANPRFYRTAQKELAAAQSHLDRCRRGSARRERARQRVAARHAQVRRARRDWCHKTARALVDHADLICLEDLVLWHMVMRPAPKPDPARSGEYLRNGRANKKGLNLSILDAGWATLVRMIDVKAEDAGRLVVKVPPAHTSRDCSACGARKPALDLRVRVYRCEDCGNVVDRDVNAARNILRAGTALRDAHPGQREAAPAAEVHMTCSRLRRPDHGATAA